ncbi:hypothetical protein PMAYCL1PPCAC_05831 [Pristionchus mayeri]|uniref:Uncharacterized protein n=1 Tax=Pristionchus mayeri TaxID=1317129 RepID=A0AAN4ZAS7_9BILA|nr:hypothetical protein PMAYCL1PPCAC_05831 [Pristionchus mayeri]
MGSLARLEKARDVANLICQNYKFQMAMNADETIVWNLSQRLAEIIDGVISNKNIDCSQLQTLCESSVNKTQVGRFSFVVSSLLLHLLSQWNEPQVPLTKLITRPDGSTFKEEVDDPIPTEGPTTSSTEVKQELADEHNFEGWDQRIPRIEPPPENLIKGAARRKIRQPLEASDMEEPTCSYASNVVAAAALFAAAADAEVKQEVKEEEEDLDEDIMASGSASASFSPAVVQPSKSRPMRTLVGTAAISAAKTAEAAAFKRFSHEGTSSYSIPIRQAPQGFTFRRIDQMNARREEKNAVKRRAPVTTGKSTVISAPLPTKAARQIERMQKRAMERAAFPVEKYIAKKRLHFECAHCGLQSGEVSDWDEHMNQECPLCHKRIPQCITMEDHWKTPRQGLICAMKCTHAACDYRSTEIDVMNHHERCHLANRRVDNLHIADRCPYCMEYIENASSFLNHMMQSHFQLMNVYAQIFKCSGHMKDRVCVFKCARLNEMIAHWEKESTAHGPPSMRFDYNLADRFLRMRPTGNNFSNVYALNEPSYSGYNRPMQISLPSSSSTRPGSLHNMNVIQKQ